MCVDWGDHHGADPISDERFNLLVHSADAVVGEVYPERETSVRCRPGKPSADALHKFAIVVLRENQQPLQVGRRRAGRSVWIERRQYDWPRKARWLPSARFLRVGVPAKSGQRCQGDRMKCGGGESSHDGVSFRELAFKSRQRS